MEIVRLERHDRRSLNSLYRTVTADLRKNGIDQWDWMYPNRFAISADIKKGTVYGIVEHGTVIGAVAVDTGHQEKTSGPAWQDKVGKPGYIHRLAVLPGQQGKGFGSTLLRFAETWIRDAGGTSIRLEVYAGNPGALSMYQRAGYEPVGQTRYPFRKLPYLCHEKIWED
jgi:ribosomal protein S18 acetylase RimI-like enzyme